MRAVRLQISFEFMLYLVVASASLTVALAFSASELSREAASSSAYSMEQFAAIVNSNIQYSPSNFYAYVPSGVCSISASQNAAIFDAEINISGSLCAAAGGIAHLSLSPNGSGGYNLQVVP
ncbi:MAG: hypothetical protein QXR58_00490 [Candidatus Micrarchaeaceae archaeon]